MLRSPLCTVGKDKKIVTILETQLDTIEREFRPRMYDCFDVFVIGHGAKGFMCTLRDVKRIDRNRAMEHPLESGLTFSVDHPSASVGKLLAGVPYEHVLDAKFVFIFICFVV